MGLLQLNSQTVLQVEQENRESNCAQLLNTPTTLVLFLPTESIRAALDGSRLVPSDLSPSLNDHNTSIRSWQLMRFSKSNLNWLSNSKNSQRSVLCKNPLEGSWLFLKASWVGHGKSHRSNISSAKAAGHSPDGVVQKFCLKAGNLPVNGFMREQERAALLKKQKSGLGLQENIQY